MAGEQQCGSPNLTLTQQEVQAWDTSLYSPFVSLVGVKKRTKVIKNSVNPVWNEVCKVYTLPLLGSTATVSTVTSQGLVQEVTFSVVLSRRGGAAGPVCQLNVPASWEEGWWHGLPGR